MLTSVDYAIQEYLSILFPKLSAKVVDDPTQDNVTLVVRSADGGFQRNLGRVDLHRRDLQPLLDSLALAIKAEFYPSKTLSPLPRSSDVVRIRMAERAYAKAREAQKERGA